MKTFYKKSLVTDILDVWSLHRNGQNHNQQLLKRDIHNLLTEKEKASLKEVRYPMGSGKNKEYIPLNLERMLASSLFILFISASLLLPEETEVEHL